MKPNYQKLNETLKFVRSSTLHADNNYRKAVATNNRIHLDALYNNMVQIESLCQIAKEDINTLLAAEGLNK